MPFALRLPLYGRGRGGEAMVAKYYEGSKNSNRG